MVTPMALIRKIEPGSMHRNTVHDEIPATYTAFEIDGRKFVQVDSYGRNDREMPGKKSQSFQLDGDGAKALVAILRHEFGIA